MTYGDVVTDALRELGVINAVDPARSEDLALGLLRVNRILDNWTADGRAVYAQSIYTLTLVPSQQPHTLGPAGDLVMTKRPDRLVMANLVVAGVRSPVSVRDAQWWMSLSTPTQTGSEPTDLYYEPAWPLGNVYLYPVPTVANTLEFLAQIDLAGTTVDENTAVSLPPGYLDALVLTLSESLAPSMRVPVQPETARKAMEARGRAFGNNTRIPKLATRDIGMPGGGGGFNYLTGRSR